MKHPRCPPEYRIFKEDIYRKRPWENAVRYIIIHRKPHREVANLDEDGVFWEMSPAGYWKRYDFPSLDEALMYVEAKMNLGILGEKE